jgi:hypothetical protein
MISVSKHCPNMEINPPYLFDVESRRIAKKTQKRPRYCSFALSVSPHMENVSALPLAASKWTTIGQRVLERRVNDPNPAKRSPTRPQQVSKGVKKGGRSGKTNKQRSE